MPRTFRMAGQPMRWLSWIMTEQLERIKWTGPSVFYEYCILNEQASSDTWHTLLFQVTWSPPLNPNGEIHGYEIRLPEPRIFHDSGNASELNVTLTDLIPYTNYSITVLACSMGGGHVGGCTESLPTPAATLPTSPEGLEPLSVVAVSESFLAISWQPPRRPNGPNIR